MALRWHFTVVGGADVLLMLLDTLCGALPVIMIINGCWPPSGLAQN